MEQGHRWEGCRGPHRHHPDERDRRLQEVPALPEGSHAWRRLVSNPHLRVTASCGRLSQCCLLSSPFPCFLSFPKEKEKGRTGSKAESVLLPCLFLFYLLAEQDPLHTLLNVCCTLTSELKRLHASRLSTTLPRLLSPDLRPSPSRTLSPSVMCTTQHLPTLGALVGPFCLCSHASGCLVPLTALVLWPAHSIHRPLSGTYLTPRTRACPHSPRHNTADGLCPTI